MRQLLLPALLLVVATGCSREVGFRADEVLDWDIEEYTINFGTCTDSGNWRSQFVSTLEGSPARRTVRLSSDVLTAEMLYCGYGETAACRSLDPKVIFTVDGTSLRYTKTVLSDVEDSTCRISFANTIVIEDRGEEMTETYSYTYGLVGDAEPCAALNARIAAQGTNEVGIDGCVVTIESQGVL